MKIIAARRIVCLFLVVLLSMAVPGMAVALPDSPDFTVNITNKVETTSGVLTFHMADESSYSGPWYPGMAMKSTVRIKNGNFFQRITIGNLGVWIKSLNDESRFNTFAENMRLTIRQGRNLDFNATLYEGKVKGILYQEGSTAYTGKNVDINLGFFGETDLEYILAMDENVEDMQNLQATLAFYINLNKMPQTSNDDSGGDSGGGAGVPAPAALEDWYHDCIEALIEHGVIIPEIDGEIRAEDYITRAEAAVFIARALGLQEDKSFFSGYLDPLPGFARGYIIAATKAGVFKGYPIITEGLPGRVFKPQNQITREELTCVLVRAFNKKLTGEFRLTFFDQGKISEWALEDIKAGVQNKVLGGYPDNTFKPQNSMTRAEAFSVLCRLLGYHEKHQLERAAANR